MKLFSVFVLDVLLLAAWLPVHTQPAGAQQRMDELLGADRAYSKAAAAKANVIDALTPMFSADVIMPGPGGVFAHGPQEAAKALSANPDNTTAHASWTPIGGGISADGTQGFTYGYMTVTRPDRTTVPVKYMSYWVKTAAGWRVAAYKRTRRPEGRGSEERAPLLPDTMVPPVTIASTLAANDASLAAAEKSFSDDAQTMGLGPAFVKYGASDAVNMGSDATFLVGNDTIGAFVGGAAPQAASPVRWASDEKVIVASSGDLGVSIGLIRPNAPAPDGSTPPPGAFFTIWRKVNGVWKYVAE
jgi:ketosteroid isomerase-like protein